MFPPGKRGGPEWRAAKEWEEDETQRAREQQDRQTLTGCELLLEWGEQCLAHVERSMSKQTLVEKKSVMRTFFEFCASNGVNKLTLLSAAKAYALLAQVADERGPLRANVYRKNLLAAWNWGKVYIECFPQSVSPFEIV